MDILGQLSPRALNAPESGIVELVTYARDRDGLIPLWVGEGDLPTPQFISDAAMAALKAGETFYTWQRGIPELRQALSRYYARHFGHALSPEHFYVVGSGMQAIQLALQALTGPGDDIVYLTPGLDLPFWEGLVTGLAPNYMADGFVTVPEKPGLGIDLNLEAIEANLRTPGTMFLPTDEWNTPKLAFWRPDDRWPE